MKSMVSKVAVIIMLLVSGAAGLVKISINSSVSQPNVSRSQNINEQK